MNKPILIITIDTEGDNLWKNHNKITTKNTDFLPRFQELCEKYKFKTTWLTNYEMSVDAKYIEFAKSIIKNNSGEIGMHLHAYNNPPLYNLTGDDLRYKPYLIEYPPKIMKQKVMYITSLLEDTLQIKMRSHRAGRWALNTLYAQLLIEQGYQVDCSVTPHVSWQSSMGDPCGSGGTNYQKFLEHAYFIDPDDISKSGCSTLLEVPMSTQHKHCSFINQVQKIYNKLHGKKRNPSVHWLRPQGGNVAQMIKVIRKTLSSNKGYLEFMIHSSELMPGGSPTFKSKKDIEMLYQDLEKLFYYLSMRTISMSLSEFYAKKLKNREMNPCK
ncbi:Glycoside hydrolase/deacetylase, beta/alpha-barrel superfamily protein [Candidatus Erwinia haradaeae]|uniref:Glycoside hydrolase/deacetylase, beta/alpha-barrel superfamily protein n=1 Tax=Candidatus Erwinia haradaeae TaxID=1922217 RepID=A0A451DCL9_9GAMM|nr:deacetylase [Candidatus Erwinia haradaeae]VFP84140.1 Glycoside hydrolase/deacetylase, beta/alpha-barrel superfamily protein [Candidatus Erwinia haradaeae]